MFKYDDNEKKNLFKKLVKNTIKTQLKTVLENNDDYDDLYDLILGSEDDSPKEIAEQLAGKVYRKAVKDYRKQLLKDIKDGLEITKTEIINRMPNIVWPN